VRRQHSASDFRTEAPHGPAPGVLKLRRYRGDSRAGVISRAASLAYRPDDGRQWQGTNAVRSAPYKEPALTLAMVLSPYGGSLGWVMETMDWKAADVLGGYVFAEAAAWNASIRWADVE